MSDEYEIKQYDLTYQRLVYADKTIKSLHTYIDSLNDLVDVYKKENNNLQEEVNQLKQTIKSMAKML